jgi:hypothetical protein
MSYENSDNERSIQLQLHALEEKADKMREALNVLSPVFDNLLECTALLRKHDLVPDPEGFRSAVSQIEALSERLIQLIALTLAPRPKKTET